MALVCRVKALCASVFCIYASAMYGKISCTAHIAAAHNAKAASGMLRQRACRAHNVHNRAARHIFSHIAIPALIVMERRELISMLPIEEGC